MSKWIDPLTGEELSQEDKFDALMLKHCRMVSFEDASGERHYARWDEIEEDWVAMEREEYLKAGSYLGLCISIPDPKND